MLNKICLVPAIMILSIVILSPSILANERHIQVSLFTPVQIFPEGDIITGLRINILYGRNTTVKGLDIGLVNHTTSGISKGLQYGFVGIVDADFVGWQDNAVNIVNQNFEGFQSGIVNYAHYASGFQLGFVNYAASMKGLQIGLVNIIKQGGAFPVFPIVNWSF
ncbi:MAG: hypothetical protein ABIJ12_01440 [bacterium]